MKILTAYEEKLTTVPRWGIVRTINKQSVADHCFLVALMAPRIAIEYFHWDPIKDCKSLYELTRHALLHDQHEGFTGDMPSPIKNAAGFDKEVIEEWFNPWVNERTDGGTNIAVRSIVKIADYLESIRFLKTELDMGNSSVALLHDHLFGKFSTYCAHLNLTAREQVDMLAEIDWTQQDPLDNRPEAPQEVTPVEANDIPF